jgi:hypothetical protein
MTADDESTSVYDTPAMKEAQDGSAGAAAAAAIEKFGDPYAGGPDAQPASAAKDAPKAEPKAETKSTK